MFARRSKTFVKLSSDPHPDAEQVNTSVSEYFRKYSQGKIENLPTDSRPTVSDERTESEMLEDNSKVNHLSCDDLDALQEFNEHRQEFEDAIADIQLTKEQAQRFREATDILDSPKATVDQKREAYEVLEELKNKITRARKT